jgi:hypothetical protein
VNALVAVFSVLVGLFVLAQLANVKVWRAWWQYLRSHTWRYWWEVSWLRLVLALLLVGGLVYWGLFLAPEN